VNYDIPNSPDVYVHRIGRTGRVGRSGRAITLITPKQRRDLEAIERHANTEIVPWSANGGRPRVQIEDEPDEVPAAEALTPRQEREAREARRPRHTKPRRDPSGPRTKLIVGAGRAQGVEPADIVGAIVEHSHLEGEDVSGVRVLERFSFAEVPADRAGDVVSNVAGKRVRGTELRLEVADR
jgi:ATP-dependent RNA helicase DeaD